MWDIRRCKLKDVFLLQDLSVQTYYDTYKGSITKEDMTKHLADAFGTRKLVEELKNPNSVFYFAYWDRELVGYIKLNFEEAQTDLKDRNSLEIERFYVIKKFQRRKIGSKLMEKALEVAKEEDKDYIWLDVWEKNHKAQRFYRYAGFHIFGKHPFQMGSKTETALLMRRDLMEKTDTHEDKVYGPYNGYGI